MTLSFNTSYGLNSNAVYIKLSRVLVLTCLSLFGLSGCYSTDYAETASLVSTNKEQKLNLTCIDQVEELKHLKQGSASQHIMLADLSISCIQSADFPPTHPDSHKAMQLIALSFVNYFKAGDIQTAQSTLSKFRQTFPRQDLLFADYTSFVDTATALLTHQNMSDGTLALLNINKSLREELVRHRNWALN